jgi:predicted nuclease with TOPRIM domain|tara:strand:- start:11 stop:178 length:168 start_codon:yes stop_codon:yes gene_type:complete
MEHYRLYELQIDALKGDIKKLEKENKVMTEELLELRDDVYDWKQKYKELRRTITG